MKVYRITSVATRSTYQTTKGNTRTKLVSERSMHATRGAQKGATWRITKIEEAVVGDFADVTEVYLND